jgi:hypothetical protein
MAEDSGTNYGINLDVKAFIENAEKATKALRDLSDVEKFKDLGEKFKTMGVTIGLVTAAVYAAKVAFDMTLEAEAIAKVNKQFEILAENAGLSADKIKNDLSKAVGGLADDTDVLKVANQSLITLGSNASHLGEIMTLARKATSVMGGDLIENFSQISQAIANGNVKMLRNLGLKVDAAKAEEKYAKSIGLVSNELSEQQKQAAMLNAVMDAGSSRYKGIPTDVHSATTAYKELKVTLSELAELSTVMWGKIAGPTVKAGIELVGQMAHQLRVALTPGAEGAKLKVDDLTKSLEAHNAEIQRLQGIQDKPKEKEGWLQKIFGGASEADISHLISQNKEAAARIQKELDAVKKESGPETSGEETGTKKTVEVDAAALRQRAENRAKYEKEISALHAKRLTEELALSEDAEQSAQIFESRRLTLIAQNEAEIAQIKASKELHADEIRNLTFEKEQELQNKLRLMQDQTTELAVNAAERHLKKSLSVSSAIGNAATAMNARALRDTANFGARGEAVLGSFAKHGVDALLSIGDGSKTAGEAMKGFMFGAIADIAQAEGQLMFGRSVWPPQPPGLAGGMALIALAGFLRSQAKGSSSGGASAPSSGGGGVSAPDTSNSPTAPDQKPQGEAVKQKSVTLQIMGSYYETEQTKQKLLDMIRETTDATDFKYVQIGSR